MSIAELIMQGTEQNTKSTAWVSDSLQKLGQQVGTALKEKEQQRQALEVMPFLQQNMQESMQLAQKGQSGEAYSKMFSVMNPQTLNNPQLLPFIKLGFDAIGKSTDDYQKNRQLGMMETMYGQRYGGEGTVAPDVTQTLANLNNPNAPMVYQGAVYDQGGGYSQGVPVMTEQAVEAGAAGQPFPFAAARQASPALQQSQGMPAMGVNQPIEVELPQPDINAVPSEMQPLAQGPVQPAQPQQQFKPPKAMLENYFKFSNKFDKLDSVERATVMDNQSILFPDQKKATDFVNQPSKDKSFFPVNPVTTIGVPGVVAVEMPKEYEKWIESGRSQSAKGEWSYQIKPEAQNKPEAQAAMKWLQDWQSASIAVSSDPKLRSLIDNAGGDILKVDLTQVDRPATLEELDQDSPKNIKQNLASVQGADGGNIQLTDDQFKNLQMLRNQTAVAQTNKARFIRVDQPTKKVAPVISQKKISPIDQQALDWANANSNDPRAKQIKQRLGI